MTSPDDYSASNPLRPQEELDEEELGEDVLDRGYSPVEAPFGLSDWGLTALEGASREELGRRLKRELPEESRPEGDGLGDTTDTDGELIDDQVGDVRAGRLIDSDPAAGTGDGDGDGDGYWARDIGSDSEAASAEEAAVHVVPDSDET